MKRLIRSIAYQTMRKYIDENKLDVYYCSVKQEDIRYFNLSSNPIILVSINEKRYYFRECKKIMSRKSYMEKAISDFFYSLDKLQFQMESFQQEIPINLIFSDSTIKLFQEYIYNCLKEKKFMKQLFRVDLIFEKTNFSIWNQKKADSDFFEQCGLKNLSEDFSDIAIYFLWYMKSAMSTYRNLRIVRGKEYSYFSASKSIASKIIAEELDIERLIPMGQWCRLEVEGTDSLFGILCEAAPGKRMCDGGWILDGLLQRDLINLNILDVICYQMDHGPNNYTVIMEGNERGDVCAFDNDNPLTFFPLPLINSRLANCSPLISRRGRINRPFLDQELMEKVLELNIDKLKGKLKDYLNYLQLIALELRIKQLKRLIKKEDELKFLATNDWNEKTAEQELSKNYGITYLCRAYEQSK